MIVTANELDELVEGGCQSPGCKHVHATALYFHPRCHPEAEVEVSYTYGSAVISLSCAECDLVVVDIAVSRGKLNS